MVLSLVCDWGLWGEEGAWWLEDGTVLWALRVIKETKRSNTAEQGVGVGLLLGW